MVDLNDLYNIATVMDEQMLLMNTKHACDYRPDTLITINLPNIDFLAMDELLYEKEHKTLAGYEPGDEISINVLGINFKLTPKKEAD